MNKHLNIRPNGDSPREALDQRFRAPLLAYFFKRVHNRAEAEDLTQEAFVRLAVHPDRNSGETIHAYVFTIAANLLRDRARIRQSRSAAGHYVLNEVLVNSAPSLVEERTPERVLLAREALRDVVEALAELSERTRDIFVLSRLERVPQREIAALHGITVSAVEKHIIKALAHLGARNLRL